LNQDTGKVDIIRMEKWHGPFQQGITFDIEQITLNGNGSDETGQFYLTGHISTESITINMIKMTFGKRFCFKIFIQTL